MPAPSLGTLYQPTAALGQKQSIIIYYLIGMLT